VRAGGAKLVSTEANAIMVRALLAEPGTELRAVADNAVQQLVLFATGDGLQPWPQNVTPWIVGDFPRFEANTYLAARQTNEEQLVPGWLGSLHCVVALLGVALCVVLLPMTLGRRQRIGGFIALALLVLPLNALITGGLSGPHDRYQSRVMWLPPLLAALAIITISNRVRGRPASQQDGPQQDRLQSAPRGRGKPCPPAAPTRATLGEGRLR